MFGRRVLYLPGFFSYAGGASVQDRQCAEFTQEGVSRAGENGPPYVPALCSQSDISSVCSEFEVDLHVKTVKEDRGQQPCMVSRGRNRPGNCACSSALKRDTCWRGEN
ncbi:Hypothetical predicted protein [Xyrichtys novacula]|uniref:Uncharacterized protein n=1 Tax=Xyrichtys novacula TaxID=13765 RepID=A0AAV1F3D1_XYRNO|nr:Hypothetical predicted protein [Xyrichtys novacula]